VKTADQHVLKQIVDKLQELAFPDLEMFSKLTCDDIFGFSKSDWSDMAKDKKVLGITMYNFVQSLAS
jgi:hypothetical protein